MNKKGIFYTLSLGLISLVILALAILFFRHSMEMGSRLVELDFSQKIYDLDTSTESAFVEAFEQKTGITLNYSLQSFTIQDSFPINHTSIDNIFTNLKNNIENDFSLININLTDFLSTHNIVFLPLNIKYNHNQSNTIFVTSNSNITGYNITLSFQGNITNCDTAYASDGNLSIDFLGTGSESSCELSQNDIKSADITILVNSQQVLIDLASNGSLRIQSDSPASSDVTVYFNPLAEYGFFSIPIGIEINEPAFNFTKKSNIVLGSLLKN